MNITIKITGQVPYTTTTLEMTAQIASDQVTQETVWHVVERLQDQLSRAIDAEMSRLGIKLGPDGLRISE